MNDYNPNDDVDLQADLAELEGAKDADTEKSFFQQGREFNQDVRKWMGKLPRNVTVGLIDAAVNTADFIGDVGAAADKNVERKEQAAVAAGATPLKTPQQKREQDANAPGSLYDDHLRGPLSEFRNYLAQGSNTADKMTQAVAQFAIPAIAWTKALGGVQAVSKIRGAANVVGGESIAAATALAPEEGRVADLLDLSRGLEGRLGETMRALSPDGGLVNAYIDYMSSRDGDSEAEGRFKNVVDNLVTTLVFAGVLKAGAVGIRAGRKALTAPPPTMIEPGAIDAPAPSAAVDETFVSAESVDDSVGELAMGDVVKFDDKLDFLSVDRLEQLQKQALAEWNPKDPASYDRMKAKEEPIGMALTRARLRDARAEGRGKAAEVFPGFNVIPTGTKVRASSGLKYENAEGVVVGARPVQLTDGIYRLPLVDFGDGKPRTVLPDGVKEVFAPRPVKDAPGAVPDVTGELAVGYRDAPNSLMGYKKEGPQTAFADSKYKHVEYVRVKLPGGDTFLDAMRGLNSTHTIERARRNWKGAEIETVSREQVLAEDPKLLNEVEAVVPGKLPAAPKGWDTTDGIELIQDGVFKRDDPMFAPGNEKRSSTTHWLNRIKAEVRQGNGLYAPGDIGEVEKLISKLESEMAEIPVVFARGDRSATALFRYSKEGVNSRRGLPDGSVMSDSGEILPGQSVRPDDIALTENFFDATPARQIHALLHEMSHAVSVRKIASAPPEARASLFEILNRVKKEIESNPALKGTDKYGLLNSYELYAEAWSNLKFREAMKATKMADGTTAWDSFLSTTAKLLGISSLALMANIVEQGNDGEGA